MNPVKTILAFGLLLILLTAGCTETKSNLVNNQTDYENQQTNCDNYTFTHYLVNPNLVKVVNPIGVVGGANTEIVGRSYIFIKDEISEKIPIYAPKDITLTSGSYYNPSTNKNNPYPDYALTFNAGCQHTIDLSHLKEVIPAIQERLPPLSTSSARKQVQPLKLNAGDLIGYYIPNKGVAAFDFIVDDNTITNTFANQKRYEAGYGSNLLHSTCPYDYYQGDMKKAYYNLLGSSAGILFDIKDCGTVSKDKLGTLSGQWFLDPDYKTGMGENKKEGNYGNPLPIVYMPDRITIGHIGPNDYMWIYSNEATYKDPKTITDEHCYQSTHQGYVYFKLTNNSEMNAYYSETGTCPPTFPTTDYKTYYR